MGLTERLELRLEDTLLARIDEWMTRTNQASSRSDAIRQLLELGLASVTGKSVQLSAGDKLNFMLLRDLVKHLKVETDTNVDLMADAIYGGHYWAPAWEMNGLFHNHADQPDDVKFVVDVLDMWSFIEERVAKLTDAEKDKVKAANYNHLPRFSGFDGNNEGELMGIASFLVDKMNRFSSFKGRGSLNSHSETVSEYRRMLAVFGPIRATLGFGRSMSVDQLIEIVSA